MQALVRVACGHVARLAAVRSKFQEKTSSLLSTTEFWTEVRFAIKQEEPDSHRATGAVPRTETGEPSSWNGGLRLGTPWAGTALQRNDAFAAGSDELVFVWELVCLWARTALPHNGSVQE